VTIILARKKSVRVEFDVCGCNEFDIAPLFNKELEYVGWNSTCVPHPNRTDVQCLVSIQDNLKPVEKEVQQNPLVLTAVEYLQTIRNISMEEEIKKEARIVQCVESYHDMFRQQVNEKTRKFRERGTIDVVIGVCDCNVRKVAPLLMEKVKEYGWDV
jgi:hypothetical protein